MRKKPMDPDLHLKNFPWKYRKCVVCGEMFEIYGNRITCSPHCSNENEHARNKASHARWLAAHPGYQARWRAAHPGYRGRQ